MLDNLKKNCCSCAVKSPLFNYLTEEELDLVNKTRKHVFFNAGEIIVKQGAPMAHVISFNQGLAKVYIEGEKNRNFVLQFIKPTQFLGGPGIFVDQVHYFSVAAIHPSSVCFIEIEIFKRILRQNLNFSIAFMENQSRSTIYNYDRFISLTHKNLHGRIADALIYLHRHIFEDKGHRIEISRQDLAEMTGMSKDSVIRTLKDLCDDTLIEMDNRYIYIRDMTKLIRISEVC